MVKESIFFRESIIRQEVDLDRNVEILGNDLSFINVREKDRTKHVHRLHPYLGKFIPQLVEVFLRKYFKTGDYILDPFCGSGTTLVEANILGMPCTGIEISSFNCLIATMKTQRYDIPLLENEVKDVLRRIKQFSLSLSPGPQLSMFQDITPVFSTDSVYLNTWFAPRALQEILFFQSIIPEYRYADALRVILSRAARSARLITHYDLARPKKPILGKYWCIKHKRVCETIQEAYKFIQRYYTDTVSRIKEYTKLRSEQKVEILHGDTRTISLGFRQFDGIFTSPPYIGIIDYHDQHKYAYELFGFKDYSAKEIGPMSKGTGQNAREEYMNDITLALLNVLRNIKQGGNIFVIVNDRYKLYPKIAEACNVDIVNAFNRPVLMRTERDSTQYFESIYHFVNKSWGT